MQQDKSSPFEKVFADVKPQPDMFRTVEVSIMLKDNEVLNTYIKAFMDNIESKIGLGGGSTHSGLFTKLARYLRQVVQARVYQVNRDGTSKPNWEYKDRFAIPSFLEQFIAQLGVAYDRVSGTTLVPTCDGLGEKELLSRDELSEVSGYLRHLEDYGFEMALGLPRHREGSWDMMSMELIEGTIKAQNNNATPSMSVMAAFFGVTGLAKVLSANAFVVRYTDVSQAKRYAYDVAR